MNKDVNPSPKAKPTATAIAAATATATNTTNDENSNPARLVSRPTSPINRSEMRSQSPTGVPVPHSRPAWQLQSQSQLQPPTGVSVPFPLAPPEQQQQNTADHSISFDIDTTYPWSLGCTDGSFAIMSVQEQQRQHLEQLHYQFQQANTITTHASSSNGTDGTASVSANMNMNMNGSTNPPTIPPGSDGSAASTSASALSTDGNGDGSREGNHTMNNKNPANGAAEAAVAGAQEAAQAKIKAAVEVVREGRSLYPERLFLQSSSSVDAVLSATCEVNSFEIAEMWLRTGLRIHQLTNSHLRPTALQDSVRQDVVDVYYGKKSNERTHRLSPALCRRAKDANDVVWITCDTSNGAEALKMSLNNVRTAVAVPVCHEATNTNVTIIYFSLRKIVLKPQAVEFLVHMSLSAAVALVNTLDKDGLNDPVRGVPTDREGRARASSMSSNAFNNNNNNTNNDTNRQLSKTTDGVGSNRRNRSQAVGSNSINYGYQRAETTSITGAPLDLQWCQLHNVEYLTDGGTSWIHTAIFDGKPVVVKTLRPECQDTSIAINEIEAEVGVHSRLNHPNVVTLIGAGWTSKKVRFIVLERLDGGTLTQKLGYNNRIRDRRKRFFKDKRIPYLHVLRCARSLACALQYCNEEAIPGTMVLHRDLKPDNIGFSLDGQVKLIDFGLARLVENSHPNSNETYKMSGETGSLRYMAPEVADRHEYNHKADVYSFGIILWEMNAGFRPFNNLSRDMFYERVVHGGERPHLSKKWPQELNELISACWSIEIAARPSFGEIVDAIDNLLTHEKGGKAEGKSKANGLLRFPQKFARHSSWF